jgi:hypothetical protein
MAPRERIRTSPLEMSSTSLKMPPGFIRGPNPSHPAHTPPMVSRSFSSCSSGLCTSTRSSFWSATRTSVTSNSEGEKYPSCSPR